jgi:hypothetical protein
VKKIIKEYIVTYRSDEHYEVLGWVKASSDREAIRKIRHTLKSEIERYGVINATVAEWRGVKNIRLDGCV